jgi:hypothetical protein
VSEAPYYVDPSSDEWVSPNLISGLMRSPATERQHPLERQATIVLSWLLDRSDVFCRALLSRLLADDQEAAEAVSRAKKVGARPWGTLRPIAGLTGHLYPDLTISGSDRSLDLIVEIKVDAELHSWPSVDGAVLQTDAYLRSWLENYQPDGEALVRRIGTLTKGGPGVSFDPAYDSYRAANILWADVRAVLADALKAHDIAPFEAAVAEDVLVAIDEVVLAKAAPGGCPPDLPAELAWACSFVQRLVVALAAELPGGTVKSTPRYVATSNYVGGNVFFMTSLGQRCLWVWSTPPGWPYHAGEGGMAIWLGEQTDYGAWPADLHASAGSAGFGITEPKTQGIGLRRGWVLTELQQLGEDAALARVLTDARPIFS